MLYFTLKICLEDNKPYVPILCWLQKHSMTCCHFLIGLTAFSTNVRILGLELAAVNGVLVVTLWTVAYICLDLFSLVI
jgi:hypothetical protein